jgi:hypothetical protein
MSIENKWPGIAMTPMYTAETATELYLEAERRIWKVKHYLIRSVALNVILAGALVILLTTFRLC